MRWLMIAMLSNSTRETGEWPTELRELRPFGSVTAKCLHIPCYEIEDMYQGFLDVCAATQILPVCIHLNEHSEVSSLDGRLGCLTPQLSGGAMRCPARRMCIRNDALAARKRRRITVRSNCLLGGWHNASFLLVVRIAEGQEAARP